MEVIDLNEENKSLYFQCLEDWSEEIKEGGDHKKHWFEQMKEKGLRVKLAINDEGVVGGMIHYAPIEHSIISGSGLYFIYCIWVHGHKQGRGDLRKQGMGTALLKAAEEDVQSLGAKGIVAWGIMLPFFMRSSWFKKNGYKKVDRDGISLLLWKPFASDAIPPKWIKPLKKPALIEGKVTVSTFCNGWCPAQNMAVERAKRAAQEPELKDKVHLQLYDTSDRAVFTEWGLSDAIFINKKQVWTGPPPTYEKIKKLIQKQVRKLG